MKASRPREQVDQLMMDCFRWPSGPFGMVRAPAPAGADPGFGDTSRGYGASSVAESCG